MRVLELYSGIGGMHYALDESGIKAEIVAAIDVNTVANTVYKYNFPSTKLLQRNILSLTAKEINDLQVDMILMSPPCQPFTRVGLKKDVTDDRTSSFLHILNLIPEMENSLKYILIENVKGFENSEARHHLILTLEKADFVYQEFLLNPNQFSIPNTRLRYYLIAKRKPLDIYFRTNSLMENFPVELNESSTTEHPLHRRIMEIHSKLLSLRDLENESTCSCYSLKQILDTVSDEYYLSDETLGKQAWVLDIVTPESTRSCCFTKAYGHYAKGTGSVLCMEDSKNISDVYEQSKPFTPGSKEQLDLLRSLKLRYFTPKEIAILMCFPQDRFSFPNHITKKQRYKLLGNSINVHVVALLIASLTFEEEHL